MAKHILIISAAIMVCATAQARSQELTNWGSETCAKWTAVHSSSPSTPDGASADNWVVGYLSGKASVIDAEARLKGLPPTNILRGLDRLSIVRLTGEYCRTKSILTLSEAVDELAVQAVAGTAERGPEVASFRVEDALPNHKRVVETTGSDGDITGSITPVHKCETITVSAAASGISRRFLKCE